MSGLRSPRLAAFALLCLASAARADIAGPWPWSKAPERPWGHPGPPPDGWFEREQLARERQAAAEGQDSSNQKQPKPESPRRTGPFRSCGSGAGIGLAGIGVAWGLMWVGTRYANRMTRPRTTNNRNGGEG